MTKTLEEVIKARGVTRLIHFTPFLSVLQILSDGKILPNAEVKTRSASDADFRDVAQINDAHRFDRRPDCVNLSVEKPNAFFLRTCKERQRLAPGACASWFLIALKPACLLREGVLFAVGNAASTQVRLHGTHPGVAGFEAMFADRIVTSRGGAVRVEIRPKDVPPNRTTSPQAEVMVPGEIPVEMIAAIYGENAADVRRLRAALVCQQIASPFPIEVADAGLLSA